MDYNQVSLFKYKSGQKIFKPVPNVLPASNESVEQTWEENSE